ncbi:hypothetical protein SLE2022_249460 [Rubroshorea leprosula]
METGNFGQGRRISRSLWWFGFRLSKSRHVQIMRWDVSGVCVCSSSSHVLSSPVFLRMGTKQTDDGEKGHRFLKMCLKCLWPS